MRRPSPLALSLCAALACASAPPARAAAVQPQTVASGLQHPWALAFLPQGRFLVTERPGQMRVIEADGRLQAPLAGLPPIAAGGQGGLLDLITDSDFAHNRSLYFCYSEPGPGGNSTALASARLSDDHSRLERLRVLFSQRPKVSSSLHFGCRIAEGRQPNGQPDGTLYLSLGDRYSRAPDAQSLDNHHGKVIRIGKNGQIPPGNPFAHTPGALPEIWSLGHRNSQGAAIGPDGQLWIHEHGPQGGDEINRPAPGANHGWPLVSFGRHYDGQPVGSGHSSASGLAAPLHHWTPSIAPSGMAFLSSQRYGPDWRGSLFVGSLKFRHLRRLHIQNGRISAEQTLLPDLGQRVRDVRQGPDGLLYLLTDAPQGQLIRLLPGPAPQNATQ